MWLLLFVPIIALVVLILAVGAVFSVLGAAWPVLLIALGAWLFWHEDGRYARRAEWGSGRRSEQLRPAPMQRPKPAREAHDRRPAAADPRSLRPGAELPIDVQVKVEQIRRKVDVLLSYADRFPPFSQDLYLVRQTASDYLPRTIDAYLTLQRQTAASDMAKPVIPGGKTPYQELKAQLDLLDAKLDDIAQDLQRQDTDRLLANRRFLEERFGSRDHKPVFDGRPGATGVA